MLPALQLLLRLARFSFRFHDRDAGIPDPGPDCQLLPNLGERDALRMTTSNEVYAASGLPIYPLPRLLPCSLSGDHPPATIHRRPF